MSATKDFVQGMVVPEVAKWCDSLFKKRRFKTAVNPGSKHFDADLSALHMHVQFLREEVAYLKAELAEKK